MFFKTKTKKPINSKTIEVDSIQVWIVEWQSRYGEFSCDTKSEFVAFTSKEVADGFAEDLRNAFKLIRHTSGNYVTVRKA